MKETDMIVNMLKKKYPNKKIEPEFVESALNLEKRLATTLITSFEQSVALVDRYFRDQQDSII